MLSRVRRLRKWVIAGVVVVVVLAIGGPYVFIHFIEGPAPAKLVLPKGQGAASGSASSGGTVELSKLAGTWNVGAGSVAGYRVQEVLIGQNSTAVGRTAELWGSVSLVGKAVAKASFTVNMASVVSDQSERNAQFDGRIMDVTDYPTAKFVLTGPISLASGLVTGASKQYTATGTLTMHGVTKSVTFPVSVEVISGTAVDVLADVPIVFANWDISNPSVGGFVTTKSTGTLEVLLHLVRGAGNPVSTGSSAGSGGGGFGGQVTVPSTTVPPLTVPTAS
ncbi:MAG: YceI family protein [Acidimicrobiales bacterium]|jgi:polyisoprenoid-binding protein YceI